MDKEKNGGNELGMIGLGVMGRNFLLNIADKGFRVVGYDKDLRKVSSLKEESAGKEIEAVDNIEDFISSLRKPRAIMMLVPAGKPVDSVIEDLLPHLSKDDIIIDGGNSYFKDTNLREEKLSQRRINFIGVGISGGEEGARHGPSIMPGGLEKAYERIRPIFEAAAAKVNGEPCVTYLGQSSAGHFVKMVHNGIEYALMQLIAEAYDLMKRGLKFNDDEIHKCFEDWNNSELQSYLIEITAKIFCKDDEKTGKRLIDEILDVARQKGTGMWTSQSAMELQVPTPTIDSAVTMRNLSIYEKQRSDIEDVFQLPIKAYDGDKGEFIAKLKSAFYASMIIAYCQGMSLLSAASEKYKYNLNFKSVAEIWRGGCIIRALLLDDIKEAYKENSNLQNLLLDSNLSKKILQNQNDLREIIKISAELGIPIPAMMASLGYLDASRGSWLPANLIQAQRDFFGAHTYERKDAKGTFHTDWIKD